MDNIVFRVAESRDIADMAQLDLLCFAAPWSQQSFRQEIEENTIAYYLVAETAGRVMGYAGIWQVLDEGHITNVAVHPDYRRNGIAAAMMRVLIEATERTGTVSYTLEVRPSNEAAIALYSAFGFKVAGRRKAYYEDNGEDALIMWRHSSQNEE